MTNTTITAVAEAIMGTLFRTHGFASSQPMTEAAQAAIEAYETAQRNDKVACHSKSVDSESQTVREMTVEEVAEVMRDFYRKSNALTFHGCAKDVAKALAKLGTIRIAGGGDE